MKKSEKKVLTVNYDEAFEIMQSELNKFKWGETKQFCLANSLNYQTILTLKNSKVILIMPEIVCKVLKSLGYINVKYEKQHYFSFKNNN